MRGSFCPSCGDPVDASNGAACAACGMQNHARCLDAGRCQPCVRAGAPAAAGGSSPAPTGDPPDPWGCPRCKRELGPQPTPGPCSHCKRTVFLVTGPGDEPGLVPAPQAGPLPPVQRLRYPGLVTIQAVTIDQNGVRKADLDPIVGMSETSKTQIRYGDVRSIAGWRRVSWRPILGVVILGFFALIFLAAALDGEVAMIVLGAIFGSLTLLCVYATVRRERWLRVTGKHNQIEFRYDRPWRKTDKFRQTLFARCGLPDPEA